MNERNQHLIAEETMNSSPSKFSLTPEWPADLPDQCSKCGNPYNIRSNLEIGPGRTGRFLKRIAPWMCIVMVIVMIVTKLSFLRLGGNGGAMALAVAVIFPSIILSALGCILPGKTRLFCHKCRHQEFHPLPKHRDNRIPTVTE